MDVVILDIKWHIFKQWAWMANSWRLLSSDHKYNNYDADSCPDTRLKYYGLLDT
jgi:hypothetical protein